MAKWLKPPWSWNVTVFSIPLTLERMDIHKSAWGWSSRMILKVLFYYHLCLLDSVACNTAVCPDACSSIPCCSSNSTWQMQRTRKKIKVSSKERTCAPPSLGTYFCFFPFCKSYLSVLQGLCAIPCTGTAGNGLQAPEEKSYVILEQGFLHPFLLNIKHSAMSSQKWTHEGGNRTDLAPYSRLVSKAFRSVNE